MNILQIIGKQPAFLADYWPKSFNNSLTFVMCILIWGLDMRYIHNFYQILGTKPSFGAEKGTHVLV